MANSSLDITDSDRKRAIACKKCPICKRARQRQAGLAFWLVKKVEMRFCPNCRAYEKVYGKKAHEPLINLAAS